MKTTNWQKLVRQGKWARVCPRQFAALNSPDTPLPNRILPWPEVMALVRATDVVHGNGTRRSKCRQRFAKALLSGIGISNMLLDAHQDDLSSHVSSAQAHMSDIAGLGAARAKAPCCQRTGRLQSPTLSAPEDLSAPVQLEQHLTSGAGLRRPFVAHVKRPASHRRATRKLRAKLILAQPAQPFARMRALGQPHACSHTVAIPSLSLEARAHRRTRARMFWVPVAILVMFDAILRR